MAKITTSDCKSQIDQILSALKWKRISKTTNGSDIPLTTRRIFESGIFQAHIYTDTKDEEFISVNFLLKQSCENCSDEKEKKPEKEKPEL